MTTHEHTRGEVLGRDVHSGNILPYSLHDGPTLMIACEGSSRRLVTPPARPQVEYSSATPCVSLLWGVHLFPGRGSLMATACVVGDGSDESMRNEMQRGKSVNWQWNVDFLRLHVVSDWQRKKKASNCSFSPVRLHRNLERNRRGTVITTTLSHPCIFRPDSMGPCRVSRSVFPRWLVLPRSFLCHTRRCPPISASVIVCVEPARSDHDLTLIDH